MKNAMNIRLRLTPWIAVAIFLFCGVATTAQASLLWSVQGQNNTVYVLGSLHMLPRTAYPLPSGIESAYAASDTVVFETDINTISSPSLQARILEVGTLNDGQTLERTAGPVLWQRVVAAAKRTGLPVEVLQGLQPWLAANFLVLQELQTAGYDRKRGIDFHYWQRSRRDAKNLGWLESPEDQIDVFAGIGTEESNRFLDISLTDLQELVADPAIPYRQWRDEDNAALQKELDLLKAETPKLYQRIHRDRNVRWLPQIMQYLQGQENVLIIVGAMHLIGEDGVISMLREAGHKPIPIGMKQGWNAEQI